MPDGQVTTVRGPVSPPDLGVTNAHDHLFIRSAAMPGEEIDDLDRSAAEVRDAAEAGLRTVVEMTPIGLGRRPDLLRALSASTGVNVVAATGFHRDAHYPEGHWVHDATATDLVDRIVTDIVTGMHPNDWDDPTATLDPARAGVIKAGASYHHISAGEGRRLEAAAEGSRRTGVAVLVHAEVGTAGHEIVDLLEASGATADRIILSHMDRNPDAELHAEIASRGVSLEYNTAGRTKYHPDSTVLDLIEAMVGSGYGDSLMLGGDLGRRQYFRAYGGGPGMRYLYDVFVPRLRRRIGDEATNAILVANPARLYMARPT